jgi:uncharacterized ferritin-like protein (DUF455 family)
MRAQDFIKELESLKDERLRVMVESGRGALGDSRAPGGPEEGGDLVRLLEVALANEISVAELAAAWVSSTPELDVRVALARQAGDEARHFQLVEGRLANLGFDIGRFTPPGPNPLFDYLRTLPTSVERVAAGLFTLESIAYNVNENFMRLCAGRGDDETVRIYREHIQPDEQTHQRLGRILLEKYATSDESQTAARRAVLRTLEIASVLRAKAAERIGTCRFPGC